MKIKDALLDEQPVGIRDGNMFKDNYSIELDDFRKNVSNGKWTQIFLFYQIRWSHDGFWWANDQNLKKFYYSFLKV